MSVLLQCVHVTHKDNFTTDINQSSRQSNFFFILPWAYKQVTKWLRMNKEGTQFTYESIIQFLLLAVEWALEKYKQYTKYYCNSE